MLVLPLKLSMLCTGFCVKTPIDPFGLARIVIFVTDEDFGALGEIPPPLNLDPSPMAPQPLRRRRVFLLQVSVGSELFEVEVLLRPISKAF